MRETETEAFYVKMVGLLTASDEDFLIGGAFAVFHYTGIRRDTKDLDVFCRAADCERILRFFQERGFQVERTDARWLAKVYEGDYFVDLIFNTPNNICEVDDSWFDHAVEATLLGHGVRYVGPEDLIWCKTYVQNRFRYDGADIYHIYLRYGARLDWRHLLNRLSRHWPLLLSSVLTFRFLYPADYRGIIPAWLTRTLLERMEADDALPAVERRVCLGPLIDQHQYATDLEDWGYKVLEV